MLTELVIFPLFALLKGLLWTALFLPHRHLHQSGALTMDALQDPAPDPVEGMEEDIADKVGPRVEGRREGHLLITQPGLRALVGAVASGCRPHGVRGWVRGGGGAIRGSLDPPPVLTLSSKFPQRPSGCGVEGSVSWCAWRGD